MFAVRMTSHHLRRAAAVLTLIGAGFPVMAGSWTNILTPAGAEAGAAPAVLPGVLLGLSRYPDQPLQPGNDLTVPRLHAGYGTGMLHGYVALAPSSLTAVPEIAETGSFGIGISYAPSGTLSVQGELEHRGGDDTGEGGWQDRVRLSASFRF
jgi:hypothetical protein